MTVMDRTVIPQAFVRQVLFCKKKEDNMKKIFV